MKTTPPLSNHDKEYEALSKELDALFRAALRRNAEHAADVARDLGLDKLAERFLAETKEKSQDPGHS